MGTTDECNKDQPAPTGLDMLINFNLNSADLTPQARQNLNEFAKALKDDRLQAATFVVEGYTDASGDERYNDNFSARRAGVGYRVPARQRRQPRQSRGDWQGRTESARA